jgi:hypothetical protein
MSTFIFNKQQMVANIDKLCKTFESKGLDFSIYYSVKTNNARLVLETISQKCGYEIVSEYEWELIKPFKPKTVVLNGPSKSQDLIQDILDSGIETLYFNADNDTDFEILDNFQDKLGKEIKLGIRVYFNKEGVWNRFGFDIDSKKLKQYLSLYGKVLSGFHFHFSTNNFKLANYEAILSKIGTLVEQQNLNLKYIDIGGGLPGANEYMYQTLIYEKLPELIANSPVKNLAIFSEVGRYVVVNAFNLETQVVSVKQVADHEYDIAIDTNILHFPCYDESVILFSFLKDKMDYLGIELLAPSIEVLKKIRKTELEKLKTVTIPPQQRVSSVEEAQKFAQKSIKGKLHNVLLAIRGGRIVSYLEMEKLAIDSNGATWFGKMTTSKDKFDSMNKLVSEIGFQDAIIEVEGIVEEETNKYHVYEINSRPPAWIYAASLNGQNFFETYLNPGKEVVLNKKEAYFGRETLHFISNTKDLSRYSNLKMFSKGAAYKSENQKYPSDILL